MATRLTLRTLQDLFLTICYSDSIWIKCLGWKSCPGWPLVRQNVAVELVEIFDGRKWHQPVNVEVCEIFFLGFCYKFEMERMACYNLDFKKKREKKKLLFSEKVITSPNCEIWVRNEGTLWGGIRWTSNAMAGSWDGAGRTSAVLALGSRNCPKDNFRVCCNPATFYRPSFFNYSYFFIIISWIT